MAYVARAHVSENVCVSKLRYVISSHSYKFRASVFFTIRDASENRVNDFASFTRRKALFVLITYVSDVYAYNNAISHI